MIWIMTSTEQDAPGVPNELDKWHMQNFRRSPYPRNKSVVITVSDNETVRARHIAVYCNISTGVSMSEFEVFGMGKYVS